MPLDTTYCPSCGKQEPCPCVTDRELDRKLAALCDMTLEEWDQQSADIKSGKLKLDTSWLE